MSYRRLHPECGQNRTYSACPNHRLTGYFRLEVENARSTSALPLYAEVKIEKSRLLRRVLEEFLPVFSNPFECFC